MWFEKFVVILITALFIGGMFAFMPGPTWARILVATIFLALEIGTIVFTRQPRAPGEHPHSMKR
jgi:hypothetical protein